MSINNLVPLLKDKEFLFSLFAVKDIAELRHVFELRDIILTAEEVEDLMDIIEVCRLDGQALPDDKLDKVVGGMQSSQIFEIFKMLKEYSEK